MPCLFLTSFLSSICTDITVAYCAPMNDEYKVFEMCKFYTKYSANMYTYSKLATCLKWKHQTKSKRLAVQSATKCVRTSYVSMLIMLILSERFYNSSSPCTSYVHTQCTYICMYVYVTYTMCIYKYRYMSKLRLPPTLRAAKPVTIQYVRRKHLHVTYVTSGLDLTYGYARARHIGVGRFSRGE
jgi:hypothetical protein